jgi:translation initiation factor 4E
MRKEANGYSLKHLKFLLIECIQVIHTHKASTYQIWSKLVLAVVGEQFEYGDSLCGVVLSVRPRGDSIQIWNSTADDTVAIEKTTTQLKSLIGYQVHTPFLKVS